MAQAGLHAYLSLKSKKWIPDKKYFIAFLLGSIIPDIDIIFCAIASYYIPIEEAVYFFHRTITHSIITLAAIYLVFLITYEIKKNNSILNSAYGFIAGMSFHLLIDIFFWFDSIDLFWPLPIPNINLWFNMDVNNDILNIILASEFIFFRLIAYKLIHIVINNPRNNGNYINYLNLWMKFETLSFMIFIFVILLLPKLNLLFFGMLYIPSILMLIFSIWKIKDSIK